MVARRRWPGQRAREFVAAAHRTPQFCKQDKKVLGQGGRSTRLITTRTETTGALRSRRSDAQRWRTSLYGGYAAVSYEQQCEQHPVRLWHRRCCHQRLRQRLEHLVARYAHAVERHQGLLLGSGRDVLEAQQRDFDRLAQRWVPWRCHRILVRRRQIRCSRPTRTTGQFASVSTAISIPDDICGLRDNDLRRETAGGFVLRATNSASCPRLSRASTSSRHCRKEVVVGREIDERSDTVLRTAMPGHDK